MRATPPFIFGICAVMASIGHLAADPLSQTQVSLTQGSSNTWNADWVGVSGRTYFVQVSTDLVNWFFAPSIEFGFGLKSLGVDSGGVPKFFLRLQYVDFPGVTSQAERNRIITQNDYDSQGKVYQQRLQGDSNKLFQLFFSGYYNVERNPEGGEKTYQYDSDGRGVSIIDVLGNESLIVYDGQNRKIIVADPENNRPGNYRGSWMTYNADHNLISLRVPKRSNADPNPYYTATREYDSQLRLWKDYDYKGKYVEYGYTTKHQIQTIKDRKGQLTQTNTYNTNGTLASVKDGDNKITTYSNYDSFGNAQTVTYPAVIVDGVSVIPTEVFKFDARGYTNTRNKVFDFTVDDNGRETSLKTPLQKETTRDWNNRGLLAYVQEPSGDREEFGYDNMGRVSQTLYKRGSTTITVVRDLDKQGNLKKLTEGTQELAFTYDTRNRMRSFTNAAGKTLGYRYDGNGNLIELIYPGNRGSVFYTWNSMNQLTSVTDWANRVTQYQYDIGGRITRIQRSNGTQRRFTYDVVNQLVGISEISAAGQPLLYSINRYDEGGRKDREVLFPASHSYTAPAFSATYDDDNRLASFNGTSVVHDDDGNMTSGPLGNAGSSTFVYDSRNRLTSAGGVAYGYDPAGARVSIIDGAVETQWTIDPNAALSRPLMREKNGVTTWYVYGIGLLYQVSGTGEATTYHYDSRGSTVALTQDDGTSVVDRFEYDPYGRETWRQSTFDTPFRYCGEYGVQTDSNSLLQMRARYYSPQIRRFVNADPTGFGGGNNWYAYANGDPISNNDPSGLITVGIGLQAGGGIGLGLTGSVGVYVGKTGWNPFRGWSSGLLGSGCGGIAAGAGGSGAIFLQATNAENVNNLKGPGFEVGGSGGELIVGGIDYVGGLGNEDGSNFPINTMTYSGISLNLGLGGGTPIEGHANLTGTAGFTTDPWPTTAPAPDPYPDYNPWKPTVGPQYNSYGHSNRSK